GATLRTPPIVSSPSISSARTRNMAPPTGDGAEAGPPVSKPPRLTGLGLDCGMSSPAAEWPGRTLTALSVGWAWFSLPERTAGAEEQRNRCILWSEVSPIPRSLRYLHAGSRVEEGPRSRGDVAGAARVRGWGSSHLHQPVGAG